jgi:hypothetical protein
LGMISFNPQISSGKAFNALLSAIRSNLLLLYTSSSPTKLTKSNFQPRRSSCSLIQVPNFQGLGFRTSLDLYLESDVVKLDI